MRVFQRDNASIHTAHVSRDWFKSKSTQVTKWPSKSPDLNPIENVWGILSRRDYANRRQFSNVAVIKSAVVRERENLDQRFC